MGDLALHSIGWKAFQDLCAQVCEDVLRRPVQIYRDAQDGGQDAVFLTRVGGRSRDATVQCKHSSDERRRLRLGDLTPELATVEALVRAGQADTYVLMTSMGVDAPVAHKIKDALRARGVKRPYVFGREWLIRRIRTSSRLRPLVPQVYGLGDLAAILDERMVSRTRALLDQWLPKLRLYVPTEAHRAAVRALNEHGAVLLLGNPSAGKSTIGAILSTIASEDEDHTVLYLTSPRNFEAGWNPSDRKRFFWIDDAFGPNVMRDEYVQDWSSAFRKVQAAIGHGNRFVLTSRRHIYERARPLLGQRNLAAFADGRAVVDVGTLTAGEKAQILYNHIAFGEQTQSWKRAVKPHLAAIANVETFLPGVAERLADPAFTRGLATTPGELLRFMREPREHLAGTIRALDEQLRAALILIYVHRGTLAADQWGDEAKAAGIVDLFDEAWQLGRNIGEGLERHGVHAFDLERLHEALSLGVIVGIAAPAHRANKPVLGQDLPIGLCRVLTPAVRVVVGPWSSSSEDPAIRSISPARTVHPQGPTPGWAATVPIDDLSRPRRFRPPRSRAEACEWFAVSGPANR